jgi:hypothetical protein
MIPHARVRRLRSARGNTLMGASSELVMPVSHEYSPAPKSVKNTFNFRSCKSDGALPRMGELVVLQHVGDGGKAVQAILGQDVCYVAPHGFLEVWRLKTVRMTHNIHATGILIDLAETSMRVHAYERMRIRIWHHFSHLKPGEHVGEVHELATKLAKESLEYRTHVVTAPKFPDVMALFGGLLSRTGSDGGTSKP